MKRPSTSKGKFYRESHNLLKVLLHDYTTNKPIVWGTNLYAYLGAGFEPQDSILPAKVTGYNLELVLPRLSKPQGVQKTRTKIRAEVFTPTHLVDKQVRVVLDEMQDISFEAYIESRWLEITCGEAPYIVTRYDAVTGSMLDINDRVGFLDRKLQRISQEFDNQRIWLKWVIEAYKATYGYEFQGDSLLLARENLLITFLEYFKAKWGVKPSQKLIVQIADIIAHNLFQMDGLIYRTPYSNWSRQHIQLSLFEESEYVDLRLEETKMMDWQNYQEIPVNSVTKGDVCMKFDVVIGNPPFNEDKVGTSDKAIYHHFIDEAQKIGDKACLVTKGAFLFNAGKTPKSWNKKMLENEHIKVVLYEPDASRIFPGVGFKGGVVITYYDKNRKFGKIGTFTQFEELNTINRKVSRFPGFSPLSEEIYSPESYKLTNKLHEDFPEAENKLSKGHKFDVTTNIFDKLVDVFLSEGDLPKNREGYVKIIGRKNNERDERWIAGKYIKGPKNFDKYKIFVPKSNGSGAIGEVLSTPLIGEPLIGEPLIGHTQTFLSIGALDRFDEAEACLKYIKTKFARALLGVLKVTQDNKKDTWAKVPIQDFSSVSDIDWSKSVADIDRQLYKKYRLSEKEIEFIETKVKEMN